MLNENSNFWTGEMENLSDLRERDNFQYLLRLTVFKNSISNFVRIMTGRNDIKVQFNSQSKSFTDGKVIVIGSDIANGEIDVSVGVALHESCHIIKTDMNYFKTFWSKIPRETSNIAKEKNYKQRDISELTTDMLNYIEDRYIDDWAYKSAPGYGGYYDKMYERYWHSKTVSDGLTSCFFRTTNLESYRFRVINMTNEKSDFDALPGLKDICDIIDFKNIDRLDTQEKRGKLALEVVQKIVENLGENLELDFLDENQQDKEKDVPEKSEKGEKSENVDTKEKSDQSDTDVKESDLKDEIDEQLDFLRGNISKSELTNKELELIDSIEKSETTLKVSGGTDGVPIIPCMVIKRINREIIQSGIIPMASPSLTPSDEFVRKGISMGTILGKKLQIRGETKITKFNRLLRGKIDKRLLSGLGYNNENVFYNTCVDEYKKVFIHISVDSSQSMRQESKWENVMCCTVAICKAVSMIQNIDVCVSFRSTTHKQEQSSIPAIVVAYDSRFDKFSKVSQLFPSFFPNGATPEGLSFQSILNIIPKATHELDVYFLNFSDGEPYFPYKGRDYCGSIAANHTKRQIDKIKLNGCEVLSYFVGENQNSMQLFKFMYGLNSRMVNVCDVSSIAKTMNSKFLEKSKDL